MTRERLDVLREADAVLQDEIRAAGLYRELWQSFCVLPAALRTVGVQGDERTYGYVVVIRAVTSDDAMTADWARLPYDLLEKVASRMINEIPQRQPGHARHHLEAAGHDRVGIVSWIVWGLFVGVFARLLLPGRQRLGIGLTIVFGVAGSIIGGLIATEVLDIADADEFDFGSFVIAVGTSVGLLAIYQAVDARPDSAPSVPGLKDVQRVERPSRPRTSRGRPHLEVQVAAAGVAGVADRADLLAGVDAVALAERATARRGACRRSRCRCRRRR